MAGRREPDEDGGHELKSLREYRQEISDEIVRWASDSSHRVKMRLVMVEHLYGLDCANEIIRDMDLQRWGIREMRD